MAPDSSDMFDTSPASGPSPENAMRRLTTIAAVALTALPASAGVFEPGQSVVVSELTRELLAFDRDGELAVRLDAKADNNLRGVLVGPDERICVSYENRIVVHDEDYQAQFEIDTQFKSARRPTFGPNGHLFVPASPGVREYDRAGQFVRFFGAGSTIGQDIAFGPDGNLYATSLGNLVVLSPNGEVVRTISHPTLLSAPTGLCFDERGDLWVSQAITINFALPSLLKFDAAGELLDSFGYGGEALRYADDVAIAPDGTLHVVDYIEDRVYRVARDGDLIDTYGDGEGMDYPGQIEFVPYLLEGRISGRVRRLGLDDEKVKDDCLVAVDAGTLRTWILLEDGAELSELLGVEAISFPGRSAFEDGEDEKRNFHGLELRNSPQGTHSASAAIEMRGDEDDGFFEVESGKGTLHWSGSAGVLIGKIKFDD